MPRRTHAYFASLPTVLLSLAKSVSHYGKLTVSFPPFCISDKTVIELMQFIYVKVKPSCPRDGEEASL